MSANRLVRWTLMLSQYNYSIEYRKSTNHGNADSLSRLPAGEDTLSDQEEEKKRQMVLSISMVNQPLDPNCDPLKAGVLLHGSAKDSCHIHGPTVRERRVATHNQLRRSRALQATS